MNRLMSQFTAPMTTVLTKAIHALGAFEARFVFMCDGDGYSLRLTMLYEPVLVSLRRLLNSSFQRLKLARALQELIEL